MTDTCQITLTYRGVLGHRGVRIAQGSYGKTWTLRLADGVWTLTDHERNEVHYFPQRDFTARWRARASRGATRTYTSRGWAHRFTVSSRSMKPSRHSSATSSRANRPTPHNSRNGTGWSASGFWHSASSVLALAWRFL